MADIDAALADQSAGEPSRLGDLLVAAGKLSSEQLARALSAQFAIPFTSVSDPPPHVMAVIPLEFQKEHRLVPLRADGSHLSVAVAELPNTLALERLRQDWAHVEVFVAAGDEIDAVIASGGPRVEASKTLEDESAPDADALSENLFYEAQPVAPVAQPVVPSVRAPAPEAPVSSQAASSSTRPVKQALPVGPAARATVPVSVPVVSGANDGKRARRESLALPAWLHAADENTDARWTGALEGVAAPALASALARALIMRGLLSEQEVANLLKKTK